MQFQEEFQKNHVILAYDNVNLHQGIYEQRITKEKERDHSDGSVGLGIIVQGPKYQFPFSREILCKQRELSCQETISAFEIAELELSSAPKLSEFTRYAILTCLLTAPDFNLTSYRYAGSPLLLPPAPLD